MDAEVFAIVEHDDLAAALVIYVRAFEERCHHGITDVVCPEAVAVIAQVERFDFLCFGASFEQRIFEDFVAVNVVVHLDGDALFGLVAAPVSDDGNACVNLPVFGFGGASVFKEFHVGGEFLVAPEICPLAGFRAFGIVVVGHVVAAHAES